MKYERSYQSLINNSSKPLIELNNMIYIFHTRDLFILFMTFNLDSSISNYPTIVELLSRIYMIELIDLIIYVMRDH
jgi:hypothetical protein